jgi:hypothetical protein
MEVYKECIIYLYKGRREERKRERRGKKRGRKERETKRKRREKRLFVLVLCVRRERRRKRAKISKYDYIELDKGGVRRQLHLNLKLQLLHYACVTTCYFCKMKFYLEMLGIKSVLPPFFP